MYNNNIEWPESYRDVSVVLFWDRARASKLTAGLIIINTHTQAHRAETIQSEMHFCVSREAADDVGAPYWFQLV